jgi:probable rRNA maturation factor
MRSRASAAAPRTMILIDPDLEPAPAPPSISAKPLAGSASFLAPRQSRLPAARTLGRFLREVQTAVRLRGEVSVLLTTDRAIRRLNRQFRGKDKPTDVLSFPADARVQKWEKGDLAISAETARRQATVCGHSLHAELKILMLHGVLHLAGYDHESDAGRMARRERQLRARFGLPQGLIERTGSVSASRRVSKPAWKRVRT